MNIDYSRKKKLMLEADDIGSMAICGHRVAVELLKGIAHHLEEHYQINSEATIRSVVEKAWQSLDDETQRQLVDE